MEDPQVIALREQVDILEARIPELSFTRRAALNVIRKNGLTDAYEAEITLLTELGDGEAIRYSQIRPVSAFPDEPVFEDCSSWREDDRARPEQ